VFFGDGGTRPHVRMDITPIGADPATQTVLLDLDDASIVFERGGRRPTQVAWPSFSLQPTMRLAFDPPARAGELRESGPWALFRLFARGRMQAQAGTTDRYTLTFQVGERQAAFDVRLPPSLAPYLTGGLQEFRCPSVKAAN
jgi:type VI secretion system protein ImpL